MASSIVIGDLIDFITIAALTQISVIIDDIT